MNSKKIILAVVLMLLIANMMYFASAELISEGFTQSVVSATNTTRQSMLLTLEDTSINSIAKRVDTNVTAAVSHYLSNVTAVGKTPLSCLLNAIQTRNNYDTDGNLENVTIEETNIEYNNSAESLAYFLMRDKDTLQLNLICVWDSPVDNSIFQYFLKVPAYTPNILDLQVDTTSYACDDCGRQDYEETVTDYINAQKTNSDYLTIYLKSANMTTFVNQIWLIIYWIIKIFLFILLVGFIFATGMWLVSFLRRLAQKM
jgi:hypothetical protein